MTAKEINKILRRYIPSGTVLGTTREKLIYELQDLHQREVNKLNLPNVTNRYYFDCWKRDGKLRSIVILATSEEDAIAIFKSKYPDMNFDRPFI